MSDGCCGKWKKTGKFCDDCPLRKKLSKQARQELVVNYQSKQREEKLIEKALEDEKKLNKVVELNAKHGIDLSIEDASGKKWKKRLKEMALAKEKEKEKALAKAKKIEAKFQEAQKKASKKSKDAQDKASKKSKDAEDKASKKSKDAIEKASKKSKDAEDKASKKSKDID